MKKILLVLFVVLTMTVSVPAFATDVEIDNSPGAVGNKGTISAPITTFSPSAVGVAGNVVGIGTGGVVISPTNTVSPHITVSPTIKVEPEIGVGNISGISIGSRTFSPSAEANQKQKQQQGQIQGQQQKMDQFGYVAPVQEVNIETPRPFVNIPEINPIIIPLIHGRVGDTTSTLPNFAMVKPYRGEPIVKVKVFNGCLFDRVRLEDLESDVICYYKVLIGQEKRWWEAEARGKGWDSAKIRFAVHFKDSQMGAGVGGGGNLGGSTMTGGNGMAGGGAILPGYSRSTADPQYIIKFYLVQ